MKINIIITLVIAMCVVWLLPSGMFGESKDKKEFRTMRENLLNILPKSFSVRLTGKKLPEMLKAVGIEKDSIGISFDKNNGWILPTNEVLSSYIRVGEMISKKSFDQLFEGKTLTSKAMGRYTIFVVSQEGTKSTKEYYCDMNSWEIIGVDSYNENELVTSVRIRYSKIRKDKGKEYIVPAKYLIKELNSGRTRIISLELKDLKIKQY